MILAPNLLLQSNGNKQCKHGSECKCQMVGAGRLMDCICDVGVLDMMSTGTYSWRNVMDTINEDGEAACWGY